MTEDIKAVLIDGEEIARMTRSLAEQIERDYVGKVPLCVCVLKGSSIFMADLIRVINLPLEIDFICASSYGNGTETTGTVKIIKDLDTNIQGRDVIIVEDILDSGVTLTHLIGLLKERKPNSIEICTLLNKPSRRKIQVDIKYKGADIPDEFVVGYGLDYGEKYRNLPDICILKPEIYTK